MGAASWPQETIDTIAKLWREGMSGLEISRSLGGAYSRSAVLGKLGRLGLLGTRPVFVNKGSAARARRETIFRPKVVKAPRPAKQPRAPIALKPRKAAIGLRLGPGFSDTEKPPTVPPEQAFEPLPGDTHRQWEQRRHGQCYWPLDVDGETFSCCRPVSRSGYCEAHALMAFRTERYASAKEFARGLRKYAA